MSKFHLITLGCQMNKSDSERVMTVLTKMGYTWTEDEQEASLLGILACSVRQKAIDKVYSRIYRWNKWKNSKNLVTFLSGCVLPEDREKFFKLFDLVFDVKELTRLPEMVRHYGITTPFALSLEEYSRPDEKASVDIGISTLLSNPAPAAGYLAGGLMVNGHDLINQFWNLSPSYNSTFEAFIPIQNGCDKFCTFCAVPYTRGREVSRPSGEILAEIRQLISLDYKSITLLGQNVNSYGFDRKGEEIGFAELLRRIGELGNASGKTFWVYFTSPHPRDMTDEVIDVIARYDCLAKQIHLPLQSGDDKMLIRMNRKHSVEDYRKIVHKIRETIPQATLFTDIIVGFTAETDEQFENTRLAMQEFRFNMAYIAKYSPRPGAASSRWDNDIPNTLKATRLHRLTEELSNHSTFYNRGLIGHRVPVLFTGKDRKEGYLTGYTEGRVVLRVKTDALRLIGQIVPVDITGASGFSVEGQLVETAITLSVN